MKPGDRVILRRCRTDPRGGEIVAFLPDADVNPGMIMSYMHVGQHGEASLGFYRECRPVKATDPEARDMLAELKSLGYAPRVVRRLVRGAP